MLVTILPDGTALCDLDCTTIMIPDHGSALQAAVEEQANQNIVFAQAA